MEPKTPSKSKSPQINHFCQNPRSLYFGLTLLMILVVVLLGGLFIFRNNISDFLSKRGCFFYTVVLDCGSTGTRVNVYKWKVKGCDENDGNLPILLHSYPENFGVSYGCQYHCVQTVPGLDKFVGNVSGVREAVEPLIRLAEKWIPFQKHDVTPVFVLGTAGMRGLSSEDARQVMEDVEDVLGRFRFLFKKEWIRVLSGKEEAYYGWIALNYEMGVFHDRSTAPTLGLLDLGGSSLQVVKEVGELEEGKDTFISNLGSFQHRISAFSLPGFGFNKAFERTVDMLSYSHAIGVNKGIVLEVRHPCLAGNFLQNYTCLSCIGLSHAKSESVSSYMEWSDLNSLRLVGGSNWEECKAIAAAAAVNSSNPELLLQKAPSNCRGLSTHKGGRKLNLTAGSQPDQRYHALSGFFAVYKKLNMSSGANLTNLKEAGEWLCKSLGADHESISGQDCFQVAYMLTLIEDALCLANAKITFGPRDISWTLGAALVQGDYLWLNPAKSQNAILGLTNMRFVTSSPIVLFVFLSCILFVVYRCQIKLPMSGRRSSPGRPSLSSYVYPRRQPS